MIINFSKYHGAGNDFILIDNRNIELNLSSKQINYLCNRQLGIGADGLILVEKNKTKESDFYMKYYNSDGNEGTMCGNGGRCIAAYAKNLDIIADKTNFMAIDGEHFAEIIENKGNVDFEIKIKMINVSEIIDIEGDYYLNTGSPHFVVFVDNAKNADVVGMGRFLRYNKQLFPEGANINFVSFKNARLLVRTYERGVENETLSCGTGVTAAAIAITKKLNLPFNKILVDTLGGSFEVEFENNNNLYSNIWLKGPVKKVFDGQIAI